jgi:hypothetical protein
MLWTFIAESMTGPSPGSQSLRALLNTADSSQKNNIGTQEAPLPANGSSSATNSPLEFLHGQPYGSAVTTSGKADCEYGQRGYITRSTNAPAGYNVATDPHNEVGYAAGPTYQYWDKSGPHGLGPTQVPPGETFTREPGGIGAQIDPNNQGSP